MRKIWDGFSVLVEERVARLEKRVAMLEAYDGAVG